MSFTPDPGSGQAKLLCLLPVRNAAEDLPGYLQSVARFADGVVALDDGSTDETRELLQASPLVQVLLTNPRRESYRGWDDGANRNRLLGAAAELDPVWIISLDADERIDAGDAAALRAFIESADAIRGLAYGFRVYRMIDGQDYYDRSAFWVYRLFAHASGQSFQRQRLHGVPIPVTIPSSQWIRTTLRIQHLAGMTDERRRARFQKYREADPSEAFQDDYQALLAPPAELVWWNARPLGEHVLAGLAPCASLALDDTDPSAPVISAIIISKNDEERIERVVRATVEQQLDRPFEVIVVTSGTDRTAAIVRETFPSVRLVELPQPALPGKARNAGLKVARGQFISFPGSHIELPQGSLAARLRAHEEGHVMVTGTIINGTRTRAGWAGYFLEHSANLPDRPSGYLDAPPAHCSYDRELLDLVGGFPEHLRAGEDTSVNRELWRRGYTAYREQAIQLVHYSPARTLPRLVRHHFSRGRSMTRIAVAEHRRERRIVVGGLWGFASPRYVLRRVQAAQSNVAVWDVTLAPACRHAHRYMVAGALSAWVGIWFQLLVEALRTTAIVGERARASAFSSRISIGRPDNAQGRLESSQQRRLN